MTSIYIEQAPETYGRHAASVYAPIVPDDSVCAFLYGEWFNPDGYSDNGRHRVA